MFRRTPKDPLIAQVKAYRSADKAARIYVGNVENMRESKAMTRWVEQDSGPMARLDGPTPMPADPSQQIPPGGFPDPEKFHLEIASDGYEGLNWMDPLPEWVVERVHEAASLKKPPTWVARYLKRLEDPWSRYETKIIHPDILIRTSRDGTPEGSPLWPEYERRRQAFDTWAADFLRKAKAQQRPLPPFRMPSYYRINTLEGVLDEIERQLVECGVRITDLDFLEAPT